MKVHVLPEVAIIAIISSSLVLATYAPGRLLLLPVYAQNPQSNEIHHSSGSLTLQVSKGLMNMDMNMSMMNTTATANGQSTTAPFAKSPILLNDTASNMQIKVSWEPDSINTRTPVKFTFEFLNLTTDERLSNVTYSLHILLDGKGFEHGHKTSAPKGISTFEYKFETAGSLSLIIESIKVATVPTSAMVQLSIPVAS